ESPKKKSIEDELNKWKIRIRLKQDKESPVLWYLNEGDVQLFFETVPPGEDCLRKARVVTDLFDLVKTFMNFLSIYWSFFEELNDSFSLMLNLPFIRDLRRQKNDKRKRKKWCCKIIKIKNQIKVIFKVDIHGKINQLSSYVKIYFFQLYFIIILLRSLIHPILSLKCESNIE
ncbi:hypothetical protein RFI_32411, partial [Reticulomyxa filosa]